MNIRCPNCGMLFKQRTINHMFCSPKCRSSFQYAEEKRKKEHKCECCGADIPGYDFRKKTCDECNSFIRCYHRSAKKKPEPAKIEIAKVKRPPRAMYQLARDLGFSHGEIMGFFELGILEKQIQAKIKEEHGDNIYRNEFGGGKGKKLIYC